MTNQEIFSEEKRIKPVKGSFSSKIQKTLLRLRFLEKEIKSRIKPQELSRGTLFVTRRCDRKCDYCPTSQDHDVSEELNTDESKEVIDLFARLGVWVFSVYGGEPTLRGDLPEILKYAKDKGMFNLIYTNGSFVKTTAEEVVNAGSDIVSLAIDSISNPKFKNYEGIKENLESLVRADANLLINHCVVRGNYEEKDNMIGLARQYKIPIVIHLGIQPPLPTDTVYDPHAFFRRKDRPDIGTVEEISKELADIARREKLIINPPQFFDAWPVFMRGEQPEWECKAGKNSLCIDYNGAVLPCVSAAHPIQFEGKALHYKDLNESNLKSLKLQIQESIDECKPRCLSCVYMLEYYNMRDPLRLLKTVWSF